MELVTHALAATSIGLATSKLCSSLTRPQVLAICTLASMFPDIDFGLFAIAPLDFLAYWHRAETHSLILAPLWALLLSLMWHKIGGCGGSYQHTYWLTLMGICSHIALDLLTSFGVQLFAPVSSAKYAYPVVFVADLYLLLLLAVCWLALWKCAKFQWLILTVPLLYLIWLNQLKQQALTLTNPNLVGHPTLALPQPGSPMYWMLVTESDSHYQVAYVALHPDRLTTWIATLVGHDQLFSSYRSPHKLSWQQVVKADTLTLVYQRPEFSAFRDFASFAVVYYSPQTTTLDGTPCYWFSDLRYYWPNSLPPFRFGLCEPIDAELPWPVYRLRYFSENQVQRIQ